MCVCVSLSECTACMHGCECMVYMTCVCSVCVCVCVQFHGMMGILSRYFLLQLQFRH